MMFEALTLRIEMEILDKIYHRILKVKFDNLWGLNIQHWIHIRTTLGDILN